MAADLFTAIKGGDTEAVERLLDRDHDLVEGADPNAKSASGGTPLHTAAFTGDGAILDLLLARGADASIKNAQGKTAADIARERGHPGMARVLEDRLAQR